VLLTLSLAILMTPGLGFQEDEGDNFGAGLVVLGDVNGDGVDDFAVSDSFGEGPHKGNGWIGVVCGRTRALVWEVWGELGEQSIGEQLFLAGDVNGDGIADLAQRSWAREPMWVLSGVTGERLLSFPGSNVAPAGDVDGDGHGDLLVGLPADEPGASTAVALIRSGSNGAILRTLSTRSTAKGGRAVTVGDLDGGGQADWAVRAPWALVLFRGEDGEPMSQEFADRLVSVALPRSPNSGPIGALRVRHGGVILAFERDLQLAGPGSGTHAPWLTPKGSLSPPPWGLSIECLGDVTGDGVDDFFVSVSPGSPVFDRVGGIGLWSGSGSGIVWNLRLPPSSVICRTRTARIGDVDGDDLDDVLVSVFWSSGGPEITGRVVGLSGKTGERIFRLERAELHH
jgi:hypothetical protein